MVTRKCIFLLGTTRFDSQVESTSFTLAKQLAKNDHLVYYIEYPFTLSDKIKYGNTKQFKQRKPFFAGKNDGILPSEFSNLKIVVIPPLLSIHFLPEGKLYRKLLTYNERTISNRINTIIKRHSLKNIVYINSFVFHYPNLAEYFNPALRIYHCVDPVFNSYDAKHGLLSEKIVMDKSDLIICTSQQLYREKLPFHPNTYFVPNAADIQHSIQAIDPGLPVHESLKNIPKPIVGYFGNIEQRIDFDLMRDVAGQNKNISFVFAGTIQKHWIPDFFFEIPNIHFTGRIPYNQMPQVLKGFDVAIIPFKIKKENKTIFPLKLFEYLGAAKPVVATNFNPDLEFFTNGLVSYFDQPDDFSLAIKEALQGDSFELQKKRLELARQHTWEKRASDIEALIEKHLENTMTV
jgi:teichuronic acid biosynthesis glycosyltransferase TuaH